MTTRDDKLSNDWWPHDGAPYMLIDCPDDGMVDEFAHVPVRALEADEYADTCAAGGLQAAAQAFIEDHEHGSPVSPDLRLTLTGARVWWRPLATPTGDGEWLIETTGDEQTDEENGAGMRSDYCPWEPCEPGAPDAVEFYVLEAPEA